MIRIRRQASGVDPSPCSGVAWGAGEKRGRGIVWYRLPFLFLWMAGSLAANDSSQAATGALQEYEAKSLLLFNFAKFTTWPEGTFENERSPLIIGVLGGDPFGGTLDQISGKMAGGRRIQVRYYSDVSAYRSANILFCNAERRVQLEKMLEGVRPERRHVLTVGDLPGFADFGGIIEITFEDNRLALRINVDAARRAKIHLSANLLGLSAIVRDP